MLQAVTGNLEKQWEGHTKIPVSASGSRRHRTPVCRGCIAADQMLPCMIFSNQEPSCSITAHAAQL